ncbi:MAG: hypothetical protein ABJ327_01295 [Litoreibacter sp.]
MDYFADIFLGAGALTAAFYCLVLSRKLSKLSGLDQDLGSAIAVLSNQVDGMTKVLAEAKQSAGTSTIQLGQVTERAEDVFGKLEIMLGALEDLPELPTVRSEPVSTSNSPENLEPGEDASIFLRHSKRLAGDEI